MPDPIERAPRGRAIITFARSFQALAAAQSLGRHGVDVIVCDEMPMATASFSRYVKRDFVHPPLDRDPERFLSVLREKVDELAPADDVPYVLLPFHHEMTYFLSEHRERFEDRIAVAVTEIDKIRQVNDKRSLLETAKRLGVPTPPTWIVESEHDLETAAEEIRFPAFLKVPDESSGRGIEMVQSPDELRAVYREFQEEFQLDQGRSPLLQEAVDGEDYCVTTLFEHGTLKAAMTYRNLETYPWSGASGAIRETVDAPDLVRLSENLLGPIGWNGIAEIDFRWDGQEGGSASLIEVNPRFWAGLFHSIESGVDFPWMLFQMAAGQPIDPPEKVDIGTRTRVPVFALVAAIGDIESEAYARMKSQSATAWDALRRGAAWTALQSIAKAVADGLDPVQRASRISQFLEENREARTEIFGSEDPQAALGVLYILGSLLQNGRLPEEFS